MINFKDVTFIVPIRFDSEDRKTNFRISMSFLLRNFDTNIIVLESDKVSNKDFVESVSPKITYVYEENKDKLFHRTRLLNQMTKLSETEIVVNYDVDVIFPIQQYIESKKKIEEGFTICFPYSGKFYDVPKNHFDKIESDNLENVPLTDCKLFNPNSVGGAFFFSKSKYGEIGWENEKFVSWGHEDWERIVRIQKMEHTIHKTEGVLYHLTHSRTFNSSDQNPFYQFNAQEFHKINRMNKEELGSYIKKWNWL